MSRGVSVLGLGAIGLPVARALASGQVPGLHLQTVSASTPERAAAALGRIGAKAQVIDAGATDAMADIVVECLPPAAFAGVAEAVLASGRVLMAASIGGLLRHPEVLAQAEAGPGRLILPSGALGGLDAVRAIALHPEAEIRLISAKPVAGFEQSPWLDAQGIRLAEITTRTCLFEGPALDGVRLFPKNVNVVAALSLAGAGPERTRLSLWADPGLRANTHRIEARSPISEFTAEIANLPDPENPRTSAITAFSLIAGLTNFARGWRFV